jgi:hypothetical protein
MCNIDVIDCKPIVIHHFQHVELQNATNLHDELMSPGDERESIRMIERLGDVLSKGVTRTAG